MTHKGDESGVLRPSPRRDDLWHVVLPAVEATRRAGLAYEASGKYISRLSVPKFTLNDAGWPSMTDRDITSPKDGPINWTYMVGLKKGTFAALEVEDVPELRILIEMLESDPDLADKVSPISQDRDGSGRDHSHLAWAAMGLVTSIVARAEALNAHSRAELQAIYLELETGILAKELVVDIVVPVALVRFDGIDNLQISENVRLERLDEPTQCARAASALSPSRVSAYLVAAATHAIVVEGIHIGNPNSLEREIRLWQDGLDLSRIEAACQSIEILSGVHIGYAQVCLRPRGWANRWKHDLPPLVRLQELARFDPSFENAGWNGRGATVDADKLSRLPTVFENLESGSPRLRLAARRLFQSHLREDEEDIVIDTCIGIEALLGQGRDELTHRMGLRAAIALKRSSLDANPRVTYEILKKTYEHRSRIVHGAIRKTTKIALFNERLEASDVALYLLRALLLSALEQSPAWTPEDLDEKILEAMYPPTP